MHPPAEARNKDRLTLAYQRCLETPQDLPSRAQHLLGTQEQGVHLLLLRMNQNNREISWVSAGTPSLWIVPANDMAVQFFRPSMAAGRVATETHAGWQVQQAWLEPNNILLLTDAGPADARVLPLLQAAARRCAPSSLLLKAWGALHVGTGMVPNALAIEQPAARRGQQSVVLALPWSCDQLTPLRTGIAQMCHQMPEAATQMLQLAAFEAATNIVRHRPHESEPFTAVLSRHGNDMAVELVHLGEPFVADAPQEPDFSGASLGGFGRYIIEQSVDRVTHEAYLPGLAVVRLEKRMQ